ncbi:hypothetical protein DMH20_11655 [Escherichia coli]|nr:hypothetical protein [Escherichia coli]
MSTLLSLIGVFRHTNNKFIRIAKQTGASLLLFFQSVMHSPHGTAGYRLYYKSGKGRDKNPALQRGFEIWWS